MNGLVNEYFDKSNSTLVKKAKEGEGVAILIPCYNEASTIGKVIDDFKASMPKSDIYVYDNNSSDKTAKIALEHGAIVRCEPRQGKGNVVRQMFRDIEASYYVMVDGDDTYPADVASKLIEPLASGKADMTVGDRLSNCSYSDNNKRAFHGFGNNLVCWLIKVIYGFKFDDVMTGYRAMTRTFVKTMSVMSTGFQIETELSIHAVDKGCRIINVPIDYRDRPFGSESKLNTFKDGGKVIMAIVSLFKEYKPLAFFGWIALILLIIGLILGLPIIQEFNETGLVPRFPTAILSMGIVICSILTFFVGLILDNFAKNNKRMWELEVYRTLQEVNFVNE